MKRIILFLLTLATLLAIGPRAMAQDSPVKIGDESLTGKKEFKNGGWATYNGSNTLTLNNVETEQEIEIDCRYYSIVNFTIVLIGKNSVKSIHIYNVNCTINGRGGGSLKCNNKEGSAIYHEGDGNKLILKDCTITATGRWGISSCNNYDASTLTIDNCSISATGSKGSITGFKTMELGGMLIKQPEEASVDYYTHPEPGTGYRGNIVINETTDPHTPKYTLVTSEVKIGDMIVYPIQIEGTYFTPKTDEIQCINGGKALYDHASNTLTLNGVETGNITTDREKSNNMPLTIKLKGENFVTGQMLLQNNNVTIDGGEDRSGKLTITNYDFSAIRFEGYKKTLTIKDCSLEAKGAPPIETLSYQGGGSGYLKIIKSYVYLTDLSEKGFFKNFEKITLEGSELSRPGYKLAKLNGERFYSVYDQDNNLIRGSVIIDIIKYPVKVNGEHFTYIKTEISCGTGKATYNPANKTLTLTDATIDGAVFADFSWVKDANFRIELQGENTVKGGVKIVGCDATINGIYGGKLTTTHSNGVGLEHTGKDKTLSIRKCQLEASGKKGIASKNDASAASSLKIYNSVVTATGSTFSIGDFKDISLEESLIEKPAGAKIEKSGAFKGVVDANNKLIASEVKIRKIIKYPVAVGGIYFTEVQSEIPGEGNKGKAIYDHATKTLTLDNVEVVGGISAYFQGVPDAELTVILIGESYASWGLLVRNCNCTIDGQGRGKFKTVNWGGEETAAIVFSGTDNTLTIKDCEIYAESTWGLSAQNETNVGSLKIVNSTITALGEKGSICQFKEIDFEGCDILLPAGAKKGTYTENGKTYCGVLDADNNVITDQVTIGIRYPITIAGQSLTSLNKEIELGDGKVSYDDVTKTLTLENAEINGDIVATFDADVTFNVVLIGENQVSDGVKITGCDMLIDGRGEGKLTASVTHAGAGKTLTITDCELVASGQTGIASTDDASASSLIIENSTVTATGSAGSIVRFVDITLKHCDLAAPSGATINFPSGSSKKSILNADNNICTDEVKIEGLETYPISIAGYRFTPYKLEIPCGSGKAVYDHDKKTLTLEKASIEGVIFADFKEIKNTHLQIMLDGESQAQGMDLNRCNATVNGNGSGKLFLASEAGAGIAINGQGKTLTLKNCEVTASGKWGITSTDSDNAGGLRIDNSKVSALGSDGSICNLSKISFARCQLVSPSNATVGTPDGSELSAVLDGSNAIIKSEVIIEPDPNAGDNDDPNPVQSALLAQAVASPNPFGGWLRVDNAADISRYALYNAIGQPVLTGSHDGSTQLHLETNGLPTGIYLLRLEARDGERAIKVIKR